MACIKLLAKPSPRSRAACMVLSSQCWFSFMTRAVEMACYQHESRGLGDGLSSSRSPLYHAAIITPNTLPFLTQNSFSQGFSIASYPSHWKVTHFRAFSNKAVPGGTEMSQLLPASTQGAEARMCPAAGTGSSSSNPASSQPVPG